MPNPLDGAEERIVALVREGRDELIALVDELVAFDTTARIVGDPPRDEARLQETLAGRLREIGADVDMWEPEPTRTGNGFVPDDLDFVGRPQLAARLAGRGGGRSLLIERRHVLDQRSHAGRQLLVRRSRLQPMLLVRPTAATVARRM